jgi:thiamine biosynthesis lipoprotein
MFGRPHLVILLVLLLGALLWWRGPAEPQLHSRTALIMGTVVEIKAFSTNERQLDRAISAAFAEMRRVEELFSSTRPESEISRLSAAGGPFKASKETVRLLRIGQRIARLSDGAFEMGLGRLKELWAIETETPRVPTEQQIREALERVGPEDLQIDGPIVRKADPELRIDLGGIAKGYAVDRAIEILREAGVHSAAVNAGGDIRLLGDRNGKPWRIGIQHPRKPGAVLVTLPLAERAVVTSGDYERFFEKDGIRYHHIFDPLSGRPARLCQSVTVVAADAATADALATAVFVLGPIKGLQLLEQQEGVEGLLVTAGGEVLQTSGLLKAEP